MNKFYPVNIPKVNQADIKSVSKVIKKDGYLRISWKNKIIFAFLNLFINIFSLGLDLILNKLKIYKKG
jgi:hypothetical protein|tara:strand:+ start:382 stop:585 length:204 start_codon:yes stop_codon:yes gene_type:complete